MPTHAFPNLDLGMENSSPSRAGGWGNVVLPQAWCLRLPPMPQGRGMGMPRPAPHPEKLHPSAPLPALWPRVLHAAPRAPSNVGQSGCGAGSPFPELAARCQA